MACNCCSFDTDPTKDTDREFSLTGSLIRTGTLALLLCCLVFAVLGMGDEQIKTLSWNMMMTNSTKQYHNNNSIQEESFDYELKPSDPTVNTTLALQHVSIFGPMGAFNRYTAIDLACYPIHE